MRGNRLIPYTLGMHVSRCMRIVALAAMAAALASCAPSRTPSRTTGSTQHHAAAAPCMTRNLALGQYDFAAGAGSESYFYELTNIGSTPCTLGGYPGLSFVKNGSQPVTPVPIKGVEKEPAASFTHQRASALPARFTLPSSSTASFVFTDGIAQQGDSACTSVTPVVTLPGGMFAPEANSSQSYCGGYVQLSPIEPGVTWEHL